MVFGFFINRTLYLNPKLSTSLYPLGGLLDVINIIIIIIST